MAEELIRPEMSIRRNPKQWVADVLSDIGTNRVMGWMHEMEDLHPRGPYKLASTMSVYDQKPEVVRMPGDWAIFLFDETDRYGGRGAKAMASVGELTPQRINLDGGDEAYAFPSMRSVAMTGGIDTQDSGRFCHQGGCTPRAIYAATGGRLKYDEIVDGLTEFGFTGDNGVRVGAIEPYLKKAIGEENFINIPIPGGLENRIEPESIGATYRMMDQGGFPGAILSIQNTNDWMGHTVGFYKSQQRLEHPRGLYSPWNTNAISNIINVGFSNVK